jgi:hypothetical protein
VVDQPLRLTLVTTPDCHLCEQARQVITRLGRDRKVVLKELAWDSPIAQASVRRDGIPFAPALYIEDTFCAYGRISEGAVRRWLRQQGMA